MDFQPFSVTCVTCTSRLRVSRKELVDNIVACPKCQSLVQLSPSPIAASGPSAAAPLAVGLGSVDSAALTEDSISKPELPVGESRDRSLASGFAEPPPVFTPDPTGGGVGGEGVGAADTNAPQASTSSAAPPPNWQSPRNAKTRRIAMAVALVLGSVISATVLFTVFTRGGSGSVAIDPAGGLQSSPSNPAGETLEKPANGTANEASASSTTSDSADNDLGQTPIDDPNPSTTDSLSDVPVTTEGQTEPDPNPAMNLIADSNLLPRSPLEGIPGLNGTTLEGSALEQPAPADEDATLTELPKDLQELFQSINSIDRPQFETTEPAPKTIDEIQLDRAAQAEVDLEVVLDQPEATNMRQRLGLSIALRTSDPNGYPLNDLMLFLSQLSGVPIEVEWVSFDIVRMPINQRVKLPTVWATLEELLNEVCEENGAVSEPTARSIVVRPSDERFQQAIADYLDFGDLTVDRESAIATARTLLGQTDGEQGIVTVPPDLGVAQIAVFVCESIRRARGVAGKMPDKIYSRWAGTFQEQLQAWPELDAGVSDPQRIQGTSFASLVRQTAKLNGATCYIHWIDAANRNLQPTDVQMPRTGDKVTAADAMKQILQPRSLQLRAVDAEHWWIGSEASFDRFPVVVRFDGQADADAMQQQVEAVIRSAAVNEQVIAAVAVDPASQQCIAIIPRYLLRQMPRMMDPQN